MAERTSERSSTNRCHCARSPSNRPRPFPMSDLVVSCPATSKVWQVLIISGSESPSGSDITNALSKSVPGCFRRSHNRSPRYSRISTMALLSSQEQLQAGLVDPLETQELICPPAQQELVTCG